MSMNLRHVTAFVVAYEEGSINGAADRLGLAQPTVSAIVRELEQLMGVQLFERLARGVVPTPEGHTFYPHCVRILADVDHAKKALQGEHGGLAGPLSIGIAPTIAKGLMPQLLTCYLADFPDVQLRFSEAFSQRLSEWTLAGNLDFAIVAIPPVDRRLITRKIVSDQLQFVHSNDHSPPRDADGYVDFSRPIDLILPSPGNGLRSTIDRYIHTNNLVVRHFIEMEGLHCQLEILKKGRWASFLPTMSIAQELQRAEIVASQMREPMNLDFYLIHPARRAISPAAREMVSRLEQLIAARVPA
jgi:DNA-binding transcriptional LysR family regulator